MSSRQYHPGAANETEAEPKASPTRYRYTVVNDQTVLVDPRTHRVID